MSGLGFGMDEDSPGRGGSGRRGLIVAVVAFLALVLVIGIVLAGPIKRLVSGSGGDYSGSGTGSVLVVVHEGDSASTIGATLAHAGVVKSASSGSSPTRASR